MARLSKSHNQLALASSIEEGMKAQSNNQKKPTKPGKGAQGTNAETSDAQESTLPIGQNATNGTPPTSQMSIAPTPTPPGTQQPMGGGISGLGFNTPSNSNPSQVVPSPAKISRTDSAGDNSSNTSCKTTGERPFENLPTVNPLKAFKLCFLSEFSRLFRRSYWSWVGFQAAPRYDKWNECRCNCNSPKPNTLHQNHCKCIRKCLLINSCPVVIMKRNPLKVIPNFYPGRTFG